MVVVSTRRNSPPHVPTYAVGDTTALTLPPRTIPRAYAWASHVHGKGLVVHDLGHETSLVCCPGNLISLLEQLDHRREVYHREIFEQQRLAVEVDASLDRVQECVGGSRNLYCKQYATFGKVVRRESTSATKKRATVGPSYANPICLMVLLRASRTHRSRPKETTSNEEGSWGVDKSARGELPLSLAVGKQHVRSDLKPNAHNAKHIL